MCACAWPSAKAVASRANPSPRRSLRSGARVSEGPGTGAERGASLRLPLARHPLRFSDLIGRHLGSHLIAILDRHLAKIGVCCGRHVVWRLPLYNTVHNILTNPVYAGAYAFGRTMSKGQRREGPQAGKKGKLMAAIEGSEGIAGFMAISLEDQTTTFPKDVELKALHLRRLPASDGRRAAATQPARCPHGERTRRHELHRVPHGENQRRRKSASNSSFIFPSSLKTGSWNQSSSCEDVALQPAGPFHGD